MSEEKEYKGKLLRLFREIMLLHNAPFGYTIQEIADKVGVSYRTVYRDLKVLEQVGFYPEEVNEGKYAIRSGGRDIENLADHLQFSPEEAGILANAVSSVADNHPLKKQIMEKLLSFSGMEDFLQIIVKRNVSQNIEALARAIREQKVVKLINYRSASSGSIRTRTVEPYGFSNDVQFVKCYELDSESNKTFKVERVESVQVLQENWTNETMHTSEEESDMFGMTGPEKISVKLRMTLRAANLLQEEFPLSASCIYKEDYQYYLFEGEVLSYKGIARFIMGLIDQIEILEPAQLNEFIREKIEKSSI